MARTTDGKEDKFEGRSWLNILAAVFLMAGILLPFASGPALLILKYMSTTLMGILVWYVVVIIVTLVIASAARTQERLARIEHELGLDRSPDTETRQDSEQYGEK